MLFRSCMLHVCKNVRTYVYQNEGGVTVSAPNGLFFSCVRWLGGRTAKKNVVVLVLVVVPGGRLPTHPGARDPPAPGSRPTLGGGGGGGRKKSRVSSARSRYERDGVHSFGFARATSEHCVMLPAPRFTSLDHASIQKRTRTRVSSASLHPSEGGTVGKNVWDFWDFLTIFFRTPSNIFQHTRKKL